MLSFTLFQLLPKGVHPGNVTPNTWLFWSETQISPVVSSPHFPSGALYSTSSIVLRSVFFCHLHHHHPMVQHPLLPLPAHRLDRALAQCCFPPLSPSHCSVSELSKPSVWSHCFKALKVWNVFHCLKDETWTAGSTQGAPRHRFCYVSSCTFLLFSLHPLLAGPIICYPLTYLQTCAQAVPPASHSSFSLLFNSYPYPLAPYSEDQLPLALLVVF